jgi:hypothetical protein
MSGPCRELVWTYPDGDYVVCDKDRPCPDHDDAPREPITRCC